MTKMLASSRKKSYELRQKDAIKYLEKLGKKSAFKKANLKYSEMDYDNPKTLYNVGVQFIGPMQRKYNKITYKSVIAPTRAVAKRIRVELRKLGIKGSDSFSISNKENLNY